MKGKAASRGGYWTVAPVRSDAAVLNDAVAIALSRAHQEAVGIRMGELVYVSN